MNPVEMSELSKRIAEAAERRVALFAETDAVRLFHGAADGVEGLVIERFGPVMVVQIHERRLAAEIGDVGEAVRGVAGEHAVRSVYLKQFVRDRGSVDEDVSAAHREAAPWIGEASPAEVTIREGKLQFVVRPYDGFSVGLFLEHRENRRRIGELARGRRVLNAFAYTCGFSVAAARGGAASVESVDLSKKYLEWGKQNFAANGVPLEGQLFFCSDTFDFYRRARRQGRRYGLIVLDPPTFSKQRRPQRVFALAERLEELVAGAVELLEPGGVIFLATNDRQIYLTRMEAALHRADPERACTIIERPALPADFAGDADYSKAVVARFD